MSLARATDNVRSQASIGGYKKHKLAPREAKVKGLIAGHADMTLEKLKDALAKDSIEVSKSAIDRYVKFLRISRKKPLHADEEQRSHRAASREDWRKGQRDLDMTKLVFLDETGASTSMARLYGPLLERKKTATLMDSLGLISHTHPVT